MRAPARILSTVLCLLALAGLVTWALLLWGMTPLTAVLLALAISCPVALLYAWWLARRAFKSLDRVTVQPKQDKPVAQVRRTP